MSVDLSPDAEGEIPRLKLVLDNSRPVSAAELGRLLSALASDYKKMTRGQTLVVTRVQAGSIWIWLQSALSDLEPIGKAALGAAKAAKGIREFADALTAAIKPTKKPLAALPSPSPSYPDLKSARSLLKLAVDSGSVVEFEHIASGGERIGFKVTPVEAAARQSEMEEARVAESRLAPQIAYHAPPQIAADRLAQLAQAGPEGMVAVEEAVAIIAGSLRGQGLEYALSPLADELDGRGLYQLAEIVRAAIRRGRGQIKVEIT